MQKRPEGRSSNRATDVVSTRAPAILLLLVAAETRDLPQIFRRTAAELEAHAPANGPGGRITWGAGGSCYPQTAMSGSELLGQATELTLEARRQRADTLIGHFAHRSCAKSKRVAEERERFLDPRHRDRHVMQRTDVHERTGT